VVDVTGTTRFFKAFECHIGDALKDMLHVFCASRQFNEQTRNVVISHVGEAMR
jgi:hypothetical protein